LKCEYRESHRITEVYAAAEREERETPIGSCCLLDTVRQRPVPARPTVANTKRIYCPPSVSVRSCRVTIRDTEGIEHSAEVTAESLYEAVALGLRAIRQCSWVEDIGQNFTIRVLARDTPVEHTVEFRAFHKWLEQRGGRPSK
jgi:hypothetical protein